jgi:hypothetical protein
MNGIPYTSNLSILHSLCHRKEQLALAMAIRIKLEARRILQSFPDHFSYGVRGLFVAFESWRQHLQASASNNLLKKGNGWTG